MCLGVPPAPVYKGSRRGCGRPGGGRARRSPTPTGSRIPPPILVQLGFLGGEKRKGAPAPSLLVLFGLGGRGARPTMGCLFSFPLRPTKAHLAPRGVPVTSRYSGKIPISPGTLPISKYRLPIYQSLCLDHFETPRHVRDHIRDSEQPSVHQNA